MMTIEKQWAVLVEMGKEIEKNTANLTDGFGFAIVPVCSCHPDHPVYSAEIIWGDWKHCHSFFDCWVTNYLREKGYGCEITVTVTAENDSDAYSAYHTVELKEPSRE